MSGRTPAAPTTAATFPAGHPRRRAWTRSSPPRQPPLGNHHPAEAAGGEPAGRAPPCRPFLPAQDRQGPAGQGPTQPVPQGRAAPLTLGGGRAVPAPRRRPPDKPAPIGSQPVSYTPLRAHETPEHLVCR